jgi:cell division protein FtsW (lipid II flippase)
MSQSVIIPARENEIVPWWMVILFQLLFIGIAIITYPSTSPVLLGILFLAIILTILIPEIPLVAFVFIGVTKPWIETNITFFQSVDYTLFLAVYLLFITIVTMVRRGTHTLPPFLHYIRYMLIFSIILFIGLIYTSSPVYGTDKAVRVFLFNIPLFIVTVLFISDRKHIYNIIYVVVGLSLILGIVMFFQGIQSFIGGRLDEYVLRMTILGANPIASARIFSVALIILLVAGFYGEKRRLKTFYYSLALFFLFALVATNSRGPLVSTFLAILLFAYFLSGMNKLKVIAFLIMFISTFLVVMSLLPEYLTGRYEALLQIDAAQRQLEGPGVDTIGSRQMMWGMALAGTFNSIWTFFLGNGTGSFSSLFHFGDFRWYPHNMFFEVLYEVGFVGLFFLLLHFFHISSRGVEIWRWTSNQSSDRSLLVIIIAILISTFVSIMFSGDLPDNRILWFLFGILIGYGRILEYEGNKR